MIFLVQTNKIIVYSLSIDIRIMTGVTTMTVPTPICPTPTCLRPSRAIWITPKHPIPNPNPLTPSRLSNALPNTPTPSHLVNAFPTTFDLSSPSRQVDSRHPHSFPTQRTLDLSSPSRQVDSRQTLIPDPTPFDLLSSRVSPIPDVSSVSRLRSGKA